LKLDEKQVEVLLSEQIGANPVCETFERSGNLGFAVELQYVMLEVVQVSLRNVLGQQLLSEILRA